MRRSKLQLTPTQEAPVFHQIAVAVREGGAVARPVDEAAGLVADRAVRGVFERPQRRGADIQAGGGGVVAGPRRRVLQVVAVADLVHPGAVEEGFDRRAVGQAAGMVLTEPLPAVMVGVEGQQGRGRVHPLHRRDRIDLRAVQGRDVGRAPVDVPFAVVVDEQVRAPRDRPGRPGPASRPSPRRPGSAASPGSDSPRPRGSDRC
jgi:hypothetical protein